MKKRIKTAIIVGTAAVLAGCMADFPTTSPAIDATAIDESAIRAAVANGAYRYSPQFTPVNRGAYPSTVATGSRINVWVSSSEFAAYGKIDPGVNGSHARLATGGMIIREVLAGDGAVAKLTLMVKGPAGYNSDLGDFWFGVTEPDGTPLAENGATLTGKLTRCFGCHIPRATDDYLFGVPAAAKMPAVTVADLADLGAPVDLATPVVVNPTPMPPRNVCGDFHCGVGESCSACPTDCGRCDDHGNHDG